MKKEKTVGSIASFIKKLSSVLLTDGSVRFYRGQNNSNWELEPSLFRIKNKIYHQKEKELLKELHILYPDSFKGNKNKFEDLVVAQHYGVPTRLLDVTSNPLVALYFAVMDKKARTGNAVVYIIDIPKDSVVYYDDTNLLNSLQDSIERRKTNVKFPIIGVKARLNNPRIIRQQGAFIYFAESNDNSRNIIRNAKKIEISKSHIIQIKEELSTLGVSTQTLFPEITEFSKSFNNGEIRL